MFQRKLFSFVLGEVIVDIEEMRAKIRKTHSQKFLNGRVASGASGAEANGEGPFWADISRAIARGG